MAVPKLIIPYLQVGHGLFNLGLFAAFVYQARLGWLIRRGRHGKRVEVAAVRRHRRLGPILAKLLPVGYLAGLLLCYMDHGSWARFPLHLATGSLLVAAVFFTWFISRKIRGGESPWRTPHFFIGIFILIVFFCQLVLGVNVLL